MASLAVGCNGMMDRDDMGMIGPSGVMGGSGMTTMLSISPMGNSTDVPMSASIIMRFSRAMGSGMERYVSLYEGDISGPAQGMSCSWSGDRTTLVCTPNATLKPHTRHTIHVGGGMTDADGRILDVGEMRRMGGYPLTSMMTGGLPSSMTGPGGEGPNGSYGRPFMSPGA